MQRGPAGKWGIKHTWKRPWSGRESGHARLMPAQRCSLSHTCCWEGCWGLSSRWAPLTGQSFQSSSAERGGKVLRTPCLAHPNTSWSQGEMLRDHMRQHTRMWWSTLCSRGQSHMEMCSLALLAFCYCSDPHHAGEIQLGQMWGGVGRGRCSVVGSRAFARTSCHCWNMPLGQDPV